MPSRHAPRRNKHQRPDRSKLASESSSPSPSSSRSAVSSASSASTAISSVGKSSPQPRSRDQKVDQAVLPGTFDSSTSVVHESLEEAKAETTPAKRPNVFEFLEDDEDSSDTDSSNGSSNARRISSPISKPTSPVSSNADHNSPSRPSGVKFEAGKPPGERIQHRASSVTSRESTDYQPATPPNTPPVAAKVHLAGSPVASPRLRLAGAYESPVPSVMGSPIIATADHRRFDYSIPESYYLPSQEKLSTRGQPLLQISPTHSTGSIPSEKRKTRKHSKSTSSLPSVPSGYEYLAMKLDSSSKEDEGALPPLYRKFETVNHRVLLHLQDEIAQLEEELHSLDEYEEKYRISVGRHEGTKPMPASRRDARMQAISSLYYRRTDLLEKLASKTAQYNHALCSYNKVIQMMPQASQKDITFYRAWMQQHSPVSKTVSRFLDHNQDLVSITPRPILSGNTAPIYSTISVVSVAILLPLLAFSTISEVSGRLVVVTIVGGAAACLTAHFSTGADHLIDPRDGWRCAMIYFGFMAVAAMVIR
ncbi:hypothetical protein V8E54_002125 [Elaphomyces granulatus]